MTILGFLGDIQGNASARKDLWSLDEHDVPARPGVYILVAPGATRFQYPAGKSPVFYIGCSSSLRARLKEHLKWARAASSRERGYLYSPRYEYAAAFGCRYSFVSTWQGLKPKALEDIVLARFAKKYYAFPVANGSGAWNRIHKEFALNG